MRFSGGSRCYRITPTAERTKCRAAVWSCTGIGATCCGKKTEEHIDSAGQSSGLRFSDRPHPKIQSFQYLSLIRKANEDKMQGCGMVMYRNWCDLLREENRRNAERIACIFPHAFIHYENKLRTKDFVVTCPSCFRSFYFRICSAALLRYDKASSSCSPLLRSISMICTLLSFRESLEKESCWWAIAAISIANDRISSYWRIARSIHSLLISGIMLIHNSKNCLVLTA